MSIQLQYFSDLHLEHRTTFPFEIRAKCPTLCILGDIGDMRTQLYRDFIAECSLKFKNVLVVFGNHDCYNVNVLFIAQEVFANNFKHKNVFLLDKTTVFLNEYHDLSFYPFLDTTRQICIIGATLWSDISKVDNVSNISDFKRIPMFSKKVYLELFQSHKKYILKQLETFSAFTAVTLTHHGTHLDMDMIKGELSPVFCSDLKELYDHENWKASLHGHTHCNVDFGKKFTFFSSNCLGYPGEKVVGNEFNPEKVVQINFF